MEPKRRGAALLSVGAVPQGKLSLTQRIGRLSFLRNVPDSRPDARPAHGPVVEPRSAAHRVDEGNASRGPLALRGAP
jgi:hypothetical protein